MWPTLLDYFWLCFTAFLAGGINALAGGGTLLTFPTLNAVLGRIVSKELVGIFANGTSTVALVPASIGSAWGFRRELYYLRRLLIWLMPPSVIGGLLGAWLVVRYPEQFNTLIPWLILTAAILFAFQPALSRWLKRDSSAIADEDPPPSPRAIAGMMLLQLLIAIYGGYFGAGIGILMLSGLGLMGLTNIHQMNGLKAVLGTTINGVAIIVFILRGNVVWPFAVAMMATSLCGGYLAAHFSRRIPGRFVRMFVVAAGFALAAWYFAGASFGN